MAKYAFFNKNLFNLVTSDVAIIFGQNSMASNAKQQIERTNSIPIWPLVLENVN